MSDCDTSFTYNLISLYKENDDTMKYRKPIFAAVLLFVLLTQTVGFLSCGHSSQGNCALTDSTVLDSMEEYGDPVVSYKKLIYEHEQGWIKELESIEITQNAKRHSDLKERFNVYFKYNQTVDNYAVTCRFIPFDKDTETGYLVAKFQRGDTCFYYTDEVRTNYHLDNIRDWHPNDVYEFEYISPTYSDYWKKYNPNSPLGYYTPFQFVDIDFDGEKELLINDFYRGQMGNYYIPYRVEKSSIVRIPNILPYSMLDNETEFDYSNKRLIVKTFSGSHYYAKFWFAKQNKAESHIKSVSDFRDSTTKNIVDEYMKHPNIFSLDSITEKVADSVYYYHRIGNSLSRLP